MTYQDYKQRLITLEVINAEDEAFELMNLASEDSDITCYEFKALLCIRRAHQELRDCAFYEQL